LKHAGKIERGGLEEELGPGENGGERAKVRRGERK